MGVDDGRGAKVRVALVGAGSMSNEHARAFAAVDGVELAGMQSRTRARAESLAESHGIRAVCDSVAELYERTAADLVVVSVPELAAREVAEACFEHPWTVLLEKPAGYDVADAEAIRDRAAERGRRAYVALNRRFNSSTREALASLAAVDGPRYVHVQDQQDQAAALAAGQPAAVVGNWMYANSIHPVDLMRVFARGRVEMVEAVVPWNAEEPGVVVSHVRFDSGDEAIYQGIWNGPGPWAVTVNSPTVRWELRPLEQAAFQLRGERRLQAADTHPWDAEFKPGFRLQAEMMVRAARGEPSEAVTLDEALQSMYLVRAIFDAESTDPA